MPKIVTPWQLRRRAELYHQLGSMMSAGLPLPAVVDQLSHSSPDRSMRRPLAQVAIDLDQGFTFAEALTRAGETVPSFDIALLQSGERSGRLDACFRLLSKYYEEQSDMARQVLSQMMYPVFLFHFAFLIFPPELLPKLIFQGDVVGFIKQKVFFFTPIYLMVFLLIYAAQSRHGEAWRSKIESFLRRIPLVGKARRFLALGRLAAALEALISAGVSIIEAWELAAVASGSPALRRAVYRWRPAVNSGTTPAEALRRSPEFPEMFVNLYATGEISGKQDETLLRLRDFYNSEGSRLLKMIAEWVPRILYLGIMLLIAFYVIRFWSGYFSNISNI